MRIIHRTLLASCIGLVLGGTAIGQSTGGAWAMEWYNAQKRGDFAAAATALRIGVVRGSNEYFAGQGVAKDAVEAAKWFRLAAAQGNVTAQRYLGIMSYNGEGVAVDHAEARRWLRLAAAQGDSMAQYNLGWMYDAGNGVAKDPVEAIKWYRLAAAQGNAEAKAKLVGR